MKNKNEAKKKQNKKKNENKLFEVLFSICCFLICLICFVQARLERDALESKLKEDSNRELNASVGVEKDAVVDVE